MQSPFQVRAARVEDLQGLLRIQRASPEAPQWKEAVWREVLLPGESALERVVLKVGVAESICGFATVSCVAGVSELESLAVAPAQRRRGVGLALCNAAVVWARERSAGVLQLEVRASSAGARALYDLMGFVEQGSRRGYYREPADDAVLLSLSL